MKTSCSIFLSLVSSICLLVSCGGAEGTTPETPSGDNGGTEPEEKVSKNVSLKFSVQTDVEFKTDWRSGDLVQLMEITNGAVTGTVKPHIVVAPDGKSITFSATLKRDAASKDFKYAIIYPASAMSDGKTFSIPERQTPGAASFETGTDFIYGISSACPSQPENTVVSIPAHRFGSVARLTLKGIPSGENISRIMVSFPSDVVGACSFDIKTFTPSVTKGKFGETAILSPNVPAAASNDFFFRVGPCVFADGTMARVNVWTAGKYYYGTIPLSSATRLGENADFSVETTVAEIPSFRNPVTPDSHPDPTVWRDGQNFYMLGTTGSQNGNLLTSTDMVHWTPMGFSPLDATDAVNARYWDNADRSISTNYSAFWAPDVTRIGDKWMFYVTCYRSSVDCAIVAFSSDSPTGPFRYVGKICEYLDNNIASNIDPDVVVDPVSGKVWLFFGSTGAIHRVQMNSTGTALIDNPKYTHVAGIVKTGSDRTKVYEGVYLYYRKGYWYMFASGGLYSNATYQMYVGRSDKLEGTFVAKDGRGMSEGMGTNVLTSLSTDNFYGPGHNGEIYTDDRGNDYMVYHCHSKKDDPNGAGYRFVLLQRIYWDAEGWPYFDTGKPLDTDAAPLFN